MLFGDAPQLCAGSRVDVREHTRQGLLRVVAFGRMRKSTDDLVEDSNLQPDAPTPGFTCATRAFDADVAGIDRVAVASESREQAGDLALDVPLTPDVRQS